MKKILFLICISSLALLPFVTQAVICNGVENYLNLCYPSFGNVSFKLGKTLGDPGASSINELAAWFYYLFVGISGLAAFIMLVWAGVEWMISSGDTGAIKKAKERIKQTVLGLLLVLGSFILLQIINPVLVGNEGVGGLPKVSVQSAPPLRNAEGVNTGYFLPRDAESAPSPDAPLVYLCSEPNCQGTLSDGNAIAIYPGILCQDPNQNDGIPSLREQDILGIPNLKACIGSDSKYWNDKTMAVTQNGTPVADVLLFMDINYGGPAICAKYVPNLDFYMAKGGDRWGREPSSLKILQPGTCETPRVTFTELSVQNIYDRDDSPAALLFTDKKYTDLSKQITLEDPIGYLYPGISVVPSEIIKSVFIRDPQYAVLVKTSVGTIQDCLETSKVNAYYPVISKFELVESCEGYANP